MNVGEFVQVVIATIMLLGMIAAYFTAFLNWRNSPVLLATKEKHSDDLMKLLDDWRQELITRGLPGYSPPSGGKHLLYVVEEHILFDDLENHLPTELDISKLWDKFKLMRSDLDSKMVTYYDHIKAHLRRYSGLQVLSYEEENKESPIGITHQCFDWIYTNLIKKVEDKDMRIMLRLTIPDNAPNELRGLGSNIWAWTNSPSEAASLRDLIQIMLANIDSGQSDTAEWDIFLEAGTVVDAYNNVQAQRDMIVNRIAEIKAIPILTGNCKHIERAKEPFWGYRRRGSIRLATLLVFMAGLGLSASAIMVSLPTSLLVFALVLMVAGFAAIWITGPR